MHLEDIKKQTHHPKRGARALLEGAMARHGCLNSPAGDPDLVLRILRSALTTVLPGTSRACQLILEQNNC